MSEQHALVWEGGDVVAVESVPVPEPRPGWVTVDVAYAGICGSDLHLAAGEHIRAKPGTVLGHEFVGHLAEPYADLPAGHPVFVKVAGTTVVVGAYQPGLHSMDLLSVMVAEITIVGTRTYQRGDIEAAIELVTTGRLDVHPLISTIFPLDKAVDAVDGLRRGEGMKVLIRPALA